MVLSSDGKNQRSPGNDSFAALLADEDEDTWKDEIFATVAHEFTHHMEDFAGLHALYDKDAEFLRQARAEPQNRPIPLKKRCKEKNFTEKRPFPWDIWIACFSAAR